MRVKVPRQLVSEVTRLNKEYNQEHYDTTCPLGVAISQALDGLASHVKIIPKKEIRRIVITARPGVSFGGKTELSISYTVKEEIGSNSSDCIDIMDDLGECEKDLVLEFDLPLPEATIAGGNH